MWPGIYRLLHPTECCSNKQGEPDAQQGKPDSSLHCTCEGTQAAGTHLSAGTFSFYNAAWKDKKLPPRLLKNTSVC